MKLFCSWYQKTQIAKGLQELPSPFLNVIIYYRQKSPLVQMAAYGTMWKDSYSQQRKEIQ